MGIVPLDPARADDAVALWEAAGLTRSWNDPRADLDRALAGPSSTVLAAVEGERLVATAMVGHDGHRGWVYYLAVDPGARDAGHGRAIMAACEAWLDERGIPKINLMVRAGNDQAIGFYEALDYERSDVIVMQRWLTG